MQNSYTSSVLGTPEFMAPELYEEHYGTPVDIYAFGMCMLEMITLEKPYRECVNPAQVYKKVVTGELPKCLQRVEDEDVLKFILSCLDKNPANRPTAAELLASEFLKNLDDHKASLSIKTAESLDHKPRKRPSYIESFADAEINEIIASQDKQETRPLKKFNSDKPKNEKNEATKIKPDQTLSRPNTLPSNDNETTAQGIKRISTENDLVS